MAEAEKTTRTLRRLYQNRDGEVTKRLSDQVAATILETVNGGHRVEAHLAKLFPEGKLPDPCMGLAAAAFGMNTVLGNEIAGKEKDDPAALAGMIQDRWETIVEGEWSEGRGGPRSKDILDAWKRDAEDRGKTVTEAAIEKMRQRLLTGEVNSKDLLNVPSINAWHEKIKTDRQNERFNAALAAAKAAGGTEANRFDEDLN